jgi:nitrogen-specific signal transduction histidine kinase
MSCYIYTMNECATKEPPTNKPALIDNDKNASTLACEICSPLNTIKGAVVYLQENYVDDKNLFEFTKIIEVEVSRIEDAIARFSSSPVSKPICYVGNIENHTV